MSELLVHPKRLLIEESLGCLDSIHKIVPPCLSPLKVVQSRPLAHYIHRIVRFFHTHHLESQSINWCLKHITMINILVFKMRINRSTRHTFGPILFLLDKLCSVNTVPLQFNNASWHKKFNIHHYCFPGTIQRLAHPQHQTNCSTKLAELFFPSYFSQFFPSTIKALNKIEVSAQLIVWYRESSSDG